MSVKPKPKQRIPDSLDPLKLPRLLDRLWNVQQPHFEIAPTFGCSFFLLLTTMVVIAGAGYLLFASAMKAADFDFRYDDQCAWQRGNGKDCVIQFTPDKTLVNPAIYYRLDRFYNNYRSFVKSKDVY